MNRFFVFAALLGVLLIVPGASRAQSNLIENPNFDTVLPDGIPQGWDIWFRTDGSGALTFGAPGPAGGYRSAEVTHHTTDDWSLGSHNTLPVQPGDIYQLSGWVKSPGAQDAQLGVVTRTAGGQVMDWNYAGTDVAGASDWRHFTRKFVAPPGCASVQYRLIGSGNETVWLGGASLEKIGSVASFQAALAGKALAVDNDLLHVRLDEEHGLLIVTDKRDHRVWTQRAASDAEIVKSARKDGRTIVMMVWDVPDDLTFTATFALAKDAPEIAVTLNGRGGIAAPLDFPQPFMTGKGTWLVVPLDEGILYPVDDATIEPTMLRAYQGHGGLSMPWFGAADLKSGAGVMTLLETPDDADGEIARDPDLGLYQRPVWEASRGQFAYPRKLTYVFFDKGGYVAQAKWYRGYAKKTGLYVTLAQKRRANPNIDKLVGAANVWNWDIDKATLCQQMKSLGMDHILCSNCAPDWSNKASPEEIAAINKMGYLTSRYDIYQDVYPPNAPSWLNHVGWPKDLVLLPNGDWMKGWADIEHQADGKEIVYQGGVLCSSTILAMAKKDIPADLATHPFSCRFLDTTTASPWRECYDPAHPLNRSEDRANKMALLGYVSGDLKLVLGSETGIDPSVPYVDYYEGMMSLAPYRLPDAGYDMLGYKTPTPDFLKFQVGPYYRAPLWELVYHDCTVDYWYWGDASNKAPEVWDQRDLFNILYATPPMFVFDKHMWDTERARFVQSYKDVCPVVRRLGYCQMLSHAFLTGDHTVQMTRWSDGEEIVVNFGAKPYRLADGKTVAPMKWLVRKAK